MSATSAATEHEVAAELPVPAEPPRHRGEQRRCGQPRSSVDVARDRALRTCGTDRASTSHDTTGTSSNQRSVRRHESQSRPTRRPSTRRRASDRRPARGTSRRTIRGRSPAAISTAGQPRGDHDDDETTRAAGPPGRRCDAANAIRPASTVRRRRRPHRTSAASIRASAPTSSMSSSGVAPTSTSASAVRRWCASTARFARQLRGPSARRRHDRRDVAQRCWTTSAGTTYMTRRQVDFSITLRRVGRFRVNAYHQLGSPAAAFRAISDTVPTTRRDRCADRRASGSPTSLRARAVRRPDRVGQVDHAGGADRRHQRRAPCHILTIEDPVEYLHGHGVALVNQREVGNDVLSFADGLRAALREDPDVILLGEMRDEESISITLTLAETGHLVFATLHTNDAAQAIDRIVDSLSGRPPRPDPDAALRRAAGRRQPAPRPAHRRWAGRRVRGDGRQRRRAQPDPRRQDPPAAQRRRDELGRRHAHDGARRSNALVGDGVDRLRGRPRDQPVPKGDPPTRRSPRRLRPSLTAADARAAPDGATWPRHSRTPLSPASCRAPADGSCSRRALLGVTIVPEEPHVLEDARRSGRLPAVVHDDRAGRAGRVRRGAERRLRGVRPRSAADARVATAARDRPRAEPRGAVRPDARRRRWLPSRG